MSKDIIVMCPTVKHSVYVFKDFLRKYPQYWERYWDRKIELKNGRCILFKGETEGQQAVRGFRGDILWIDDFLELDKEEYLI